MIIWQVTINLCQSRKLSLSMKRFNSNLIIPSIQTTGVVFAAITPTIKTHNKRA